MEPSANRQVSRYGRVVSDVVVLVTQVVIHGPRGAVAHLQVENRVGVLSPGRVVLGFPLEHIPPVSDLEDLGYVVPDGIIEVGVPRIARLIPAEDAHSLTGR